MSRPLQVCGHRTKHTSRIGCCARCKDLFSSDSAFERHMRVTGCVDPASVGLIRRESPSAPGEFMWSLPRGGHSWDGAS